MGTVFKNTFTKPFLPGAKNIIRKGNAIAAGSMALIAV
jgi:hypothetical protein